jgi:hypothetical protein
MDETAHPQYLISGRNQSGYVNLRRPTAAAALKKARELLEQEHLDVRISTPRGRVLSPEEFDLLET